MLAKRIIPCLDVKNGLVVKGVNFRGHKIIGDILPLVNRYINEGADELVFYDITATTDNRLIDKSWVSKIAKSINIPFCVAGGIKSIKEAKMILSLGADKISINSPAIENPYLITKMSEHFGVQCIVIGIDTSYDKKNKSYFVNKYTGDEKKSFMTNIRTIDWVKKVQKLGAGEIVLNVMNNDGLKNGYDIYHLNEIRKICNVPLIASGGAGKMNHFYDVFKQSNVDGALAASVFHKSLINIKTLKKYLSNKKIEVRLC
ncbi:imidazole glycerol phosphate synthase subunit HisF [Buchnera aphidicola (Taiwanaphis decaspermi)]|uniref:imidazole glycerol phosphate synthase subunit HisF n=1 Tax=Buchnera aphidicola TaxID=9 RepID=UPI0031B85D35